MTRLSQGLGWTLATNGKGFSGGCGKSWDETSPYKARIKLRFRARKRLHITTWKSLKEVPEMILKTAVITISTTITTQMTLILVLRLTFRKRRMNCWTIIRVEGLWYFVSTSLSEFEGGWEVAHQIQWPFKPGTISYSSRKLWFIWNVKLFWLKPFANNGHSERTAGRSKVGKTPRL